MKNARLTHTRTISKMKFKTNSFAPFSNSSSRSLVLFPRSRYNRIRNFTNSQYFDTIGKYMAKIRLHTVYLNRTDNICIPIEWNVCLCSLSVCKCESAIIFSCWCGFPYVWLACIRIKKLIIYWILGLFSTEIQIQIEIVLCNLSHCSYCSLVRHGKFSWCIESFFRVAAFGHAQDHNAAQHMHKYMYKTAQHVLLPLEQPCH